MYYEKTYTASYQSGGSVTVKVYNTETRLVCSVTSSTDIHKLEIGGTLVYEGNDPAQQPVIHEITLGDYDEDWFACEEKTANIVAGRTNSSGQGAGMSVTNVTRWEGDVDACEVVTITIRYTGGNGIGDWSAKRGEVLIAATPEKSCN